MIMLSGVTGESDRHAEAVRQRTRERVDKRHDTQGTGLKQHPDLPPTGRTVKTPSFQAFPRKRLVRGFTKRFRGNVWGFLMRRDGL